MDINKDILGEKISKKVFYLETVNTDADIELSFNTAFTSFLYNITNLMTIDGCETYFNSFLNILNIFKDFATNEEPYMILNNHNTTEKEIKEMYRYIVYGLLDRLYYITNYLI